MQRYADEVSTAVARVVSILGHPLLLGSLAVLALQTARNPAPSRLAASALALVVSAGLLMGYSARQVRCGHWAHVDASSKRERRHLNRLLVIALLAATVIAWQAGADAALVLLLALAAGIVMTAAATARVCTLSLHLAFAVFVALVLVRVDAWIAATALVFAIVVAWSRLALSRHAPRDLAAGALAGAAAGASFLVAIPAWRA